MSSSKAGPGNGAGKATKRALPSWMTARDEAKNDRPVNDSAVDDEVKVVQKRVRGQGKGLKDRGEVSASGKSSSGPSSSDFSKLLDGVVFALSGFVNPERGILRSQALEMGAEYQPDWSANCTILVCAFQSTPKFRQVQADGGTIVSKDWITECYNQKKLVDIETYLMHVGKPWRKISASLEAHETSQSKKAGKHEVIHEVTPKASSQSKELKVNAARCLSAEFSPSQVKKWAIEDLNKTLAWLESQEEKPEASEIRNVAAEGILTCLQDAVDLLEKKQDLEQLTEQWNTVPRVVEEMIKVQGNGTSSSTAEKDLHKLALTCKKLYEKELKENSDGSNREERKLNSRDKGKAKCDTSRYMDSNSMDYDSDETIEMTEDEIKDAFSSIASKIPES